MDLDLIIDVITWCKFSPSFFSSSFGYIGIKSNSFFSKAYVRWSRAISQEIILFTVQNSK